MSDDPILDQLGEAWGETQAAAPATKQSSGKGINRPTIDRVTVRGASVATARRAGPFNRKTIYVPPMLEREIEAAAERDGIGKMAFYRFLLVTGWEAYESGRAVPEPSVPVAHRLKSDGEL